MHNSRAYIKGQGKRIEQLHVNHFHDELSFDESMKKLFSIKIYSTNYEYSNVCMVGKCDILSVIS